MFRRESIKNVQRYLSPIRRSLFVTETPIVEITSPKTPNDAIAIQLVKSKKDDPNTPRIHLTPAQQHQMVQQLKSLTLNEYNVTPNILEQTFTVNSILREINLKKYSDLFAREEVDLFVFSLLTANDLVELGIDENDQPILMAAIQNYREFFGNVENNNF